MLAEPHLYRRVQLWLERCSGISLLLLFMAQQLCLLAGLTMLIIGFSLWHYWMVLGGLLGLRASFLLQSLHRKITAAAE